MANDKDFVVKGPVIVGKDTKVTVGTIAAGAVDLSTGNYFTDTPTGDYTYTFTNPGDVQAFQIEATGGSAAVASTFSTTLYTGTGAAQTITNGLDLSGDGGLVWMKKRSGALGNIAHGLYDTERGTNQLLSSDRTGAEVTSADSLTAFNSTGFTLGADATYGRVNYSGIAYASWTFKKQAKFFDVVTWTGNGSANRDISHSLSSEPGMIIIKRTDASESWIVYHRSAEGTGTYWSKLELESTGIEYGGTRLWGAGTGEDHTDSTFFVSNAGQVNSSGGTYVAYLFAHDTDASSIIKCGSYTGLTSEVSVDLGWTPQFLLIKDSTKAGSWIMLDTERSMTDANQYFLKADEDASENTAQTTYPRPTATGFSVAATGNDNVNNNGETFIYMAIRSASAPAITWPTSIEWAGGVTPSTPAEGATDVFTFTTDDTGTSYTGVKSIDNAS